MDMSAKIMGQVWDLKLSPAERMVLLAMADHADHEGNNVRPSVRLIAWKTDYSERQVQRIIKDLRKAGLLVITRGATPMEPAHYRINIAAGVPKEPFVHSRRGDKMSPLETENRGDILSPGDIAMSLGGDIAMSPKPSYNHHEELESPRKARRSTPSEKKEPTPAVIREALADVCKVDMKIGTKEQKLQVNSTAQALYEQGQKAGKSAEQIADTIRYVASWYWKHDWRGKKQDASAPTPAIIREVWRQAIEARDTRPATLPVPTPKALPSKEESERARRAKADMKPPRGAR
jgi:hypothetical protein